MIYCLVSYASAPSLLNRRIMALQFYASIVSYEAPIDIASVAVATVLPTANHVKGFILEKIIPMEHMNA